MNRRFLSGAATAAMLMTALAACGGDDDSLPRLSAATGAALSSCADLTTRISFANTTVSAANVIAAGTLTVGGAPVPAHCQIVGKMNQRISAVDGNAYAIGFEMRLPNAWNGRFSYQANGGIDGSVATALGAVNGGAGLTNALNLGFAVISSDAGHLGSQGPFFGLDPQARLDYGYQAAATLTPMAKSAIKTAYGKEPDRSYFGGCSNGGRHTMVAAARQPDQYDGYLVGGPGFRLPLAAIADIAAYQAYATVATTFDGPAFALTGNVYTMLAKVSATDATYTESALSFMTPPNPSSLGTLKGRGAKMMVYHGTSDPIFSSDDTTAWYEALRSANGGDASDFARFYRVPGMTHCSGGPTTDQFDMLTPLVNWVEKGEAPESVVANARGPGNAAAANADVSASWSATRSRPLCAYPKVARYKGSGSIESADSFSCQ
jgi:pimeloyl-ACP methyl ester carboxylesterase